MKSQLNLSGYDLEELYFEKLNQELFEKMKKRNRPKLVRDPKSFRRKWEAWEDGPENPGDPLKEE